MNDINNKKLLEIFIQQREQGLRGGIYWKTQIEMAYNSNKIEGNALSKDQTRAIFEDGRLYGNALVNDIKETDNHFYLFNYMLDNLNSGTKVETIKAYHRILKTGIPQPDGVSGDWKLVPNELGDTKTVAPKQVETEINRLVDIFNNYKNQGKEISLVQILTFHVQYECIHPFLDGNGRTGRMLMFAQCLQNDVAPFIILDSVKKDYYRALAAWSPEKTEPLVSLCERMQETYKNEYLYLLDEGYQTPENEIKRAFEETLGVLPASTGVIL